MHQTDRRAWPTHFASPTTHAQCNHNTIPEMQSGISAWNSLPICTTLSEKKQQHALKTHSILQLKFLTLKISPHVHIRKSCKIHLISSWYLVVKFLEWGITVNIANRCQQNGIFWVNFRHTSIASSVAGMRSRKTKLPILTNNCMYNNSAKLCRYILYLLVKYGMPNLVKICSWYTESKFLSIFSWPLNISTVKLTSYSFQQSMLWLYYVKKISVGLVIKWLRYRNLKSLGKCLWLPNLWVPATKRSHFLRNHSR